VLIFKSTVFSGDELDPFADAIFCHSLTCTDENESSHVPRGNKLKAKTWFPSFANDDDLVNLSSYSTDFSRHLTWTWLLLYIMVLSELWHRWHVVAPRDHDTIGSWPLYVTLCSSDMPWRLIQTNEGNALISLLIVYLLLRKWLIFNLPSNREREHDNDIS